MTIAAVVAVASNSGRHFASLGTKRHEEKSVLVTTRKDKI